MVGGEGVLMDYAGSVRSPEGHEAGSELKRRHTDHGMDLDHLSLC